MNIPSFPNSSVSLVLTLILAAVPLAGSPAATLLNRYSFTADANDSIGGANGVLQGGASFSGNAVVLDGSSGYVDLPNGIVSSLDSISVEIWLTNNNSGTWSRIFDFGNSSGGEDVSATGTQYFFLSPQSGSGTLRGAITVGGGEQLVDWSGTALPSGVLKHVVWTYDATSQTARLYVDGTLAGENAAVSLKPSDMGNTLNNWIGRSQWSGDAYLKAGITEFRIYDGALTATEVSDDFNFGPDVLKQSGPVQFVLQPKSQSVTELATVTFTTDFSGTPPVGIQWRRNGFNIPGATNSAYSFTAALTNNNAAYSVVLTNAYLGSAYTVTSTNAVLSVTADTAAPRLLRAVSLFPNEVRVTFSEGLSDVTGTNAANYSITRAGGSLAVTAARFGVANSEVILTTATQSLGTNYTLTVSNVRDCSAAANLIAVGSQTNFVATTFVSADIGNPPISSVQTFTGNGLDASASGSGISGTGDQFSFSYQSYTNDFDVRVRVAGLSFASVWTRAALMARDGLATNAMFAPSVATPGPAGCHFESRTGVGGGTTMAGSFPVNYPDTWLRLRRVGNVFDGFASLDGTSWEYLGTSTISMSNIVNVGFALTAGSTTGNVVAQFRDFANATGTITTNATLSFEPPGPSSRRTALVISEIMYNAPESWGGTNSLEFVELWNSGLITEDLTGHKLTGDISYKFPEGTKLAPGQFLVVAKDPVAAQSFYGVACLGPYTNKLSNSGGTLRLLNELGGRLLEIEYDNKTPWPVAADGAGHSLVLSRPSFGENDPRAWSASDVMGGSPGRFEHYGTEPARAVVINEFLAHTDLPQVDSVELFNTGTQPVNLSGAWLSDTAGTNKYRIANGTTIPARGYLVFSDAQLGFGLNADGDSIYLVNSNQTRVLDSVKFSGQENGVSMGRYPSGAPGFQRLSTVTLGASNTPPRLSPVAINEIMYNPISGDNNDEYIEIYNRSGAPVNIGGWRLDGGINYAFPSNTVIKAGGYMVVAENLTNLLAKYPQLNATNAFGNYGGTLANGGERLALAMPD
ncbi:MAG TPA: lamin tail domain-containing protein, partial [Candidatus Paceibacterota bacterium]|nr:lamin tail domain-containing protein [Candidatus Paceibacterota bacterium]